MGCIRALFSCKRTPMEIFGVGNRVFRKSRFQRTPLATQYLVSFPASRHLKNRERKNKTAGQLIADSSGCFLSRFWIPGLATITPPKNP